MSYLQLRSNHVLIIISVFAINFYDCFECAVKKLMSVNRHPLITSGYEIYI